MKSGLHVHHFKLMADGEIADARTPVQRRQIKRRIIFKNTLRFKLFYALTG